MIGSIRPCAAIIVILTLLSGSVISVPAQKRAQTVYSNPSPITVNSATGQVAPTKSSPYGSTIDVSGMTGTITKVEVTLRGVAHPNLSDLDFLLVGPTGANYIFLSDASNVTVVDDAAWTFSDTGATTLNMPNAGTYLPTNPSGTDTFPTPAPAGPYNAAPSATFASVYNGTNPNGTWTLWAVDDLLNNAGSLNSGWSVSITTDGAPATFTNATYTTFPDTMALASPYGSEIEISGVSGVVSNLKVSLTGITHPNGPDIDVLLVSPNGKALTLMSDAGSGSASGVNLTFDDTASTQLSGSWVSGTYKPSEGFFDRDAFFSPAPIRPYNDINSSNALSNFNGFSPNGTWKLFVVDDSQTAAGGTIAGGWSLDITTVPVTPPGPGSCNTPTFTTSTAATGVNPTNMALGDFNNDSKTDIAVTNQVSNDVSILLGNGNGTFNAIAPVSVSSGPYAIAAGKFNADNNFDLAVANSGSNNVTILLGNGDGTFSTGASYFVGASPISIAAGDITNDTKQDLIVANFGSFFFGTVSVLIGNGGGAFASGTSLRTRTQPSFVKLANLSPDSNLDLVVANFGSNSVSTFFGNGLGGFILQQNLTTGAGPVAVEVADVGGDGIGDLIVANYNGDSATLCAGSASGIFSGCNFGSVFGSNPISVTAADLDGSGVKAQLTALSGSDAVSVVGTTVATGQWPNAVAVADFNGDSKIDFVTVNSGSNDATVALNNCAVASGNIFDFDGDRKSDYSLFRSSNTSFWVKSISPNGVAKILGRPTDTVVAADYDGDRKTDYAFYRPENGLWIVVNQYGRPQYFLQFGLESDVPVPADYDGDGKADIAVWRPSDGRWYVRQSSDNSLAINQFGSVGDVPAPADFDGDGKDDLAIYRPSTGVWYVWRSSDSGFMITQFGITGDKVVPGDYDGDGKADIAVWRPATGVWYVLKSTDGGFFAVSFGLPTDLPVVGDYEGDGKFDYAVFRPSEGNWYVQKSSDNGLSVTQFGLNGDFPLPASFVR